MSAALPQPSICRGTLRHRRFRPHQHAFEYSVFMALLDVDRIAETMAQSAWSSYNRWNWASFNERDHFGDPAQPLRRRVEEDASRNGIHLSGGPIYLLTHLRYLGYCFNPISLYYCYAADGTGRVEAVLAEVNSTFGERRNYWLADHNRLADGNALQFRCTKGMHVSPFMEMGLDYEFTLTPLARQLVAHIATVQNGDRFFDATLRLQAEPWTAAALRRALLWQPAMTVKVIGAIHWEALRLWWKGVPLVPHPATVTTTQEENRNQS